MNLPQQLQEQLNYPPLQLMDPNSGEPKDKAAFEPLSQAVVVTFLAGLFKNTRTKESAAVINSQTDGDELISTIFKDDMEVLNTVAAYAQASYATVKEKLEEVSGGFLAMMDAKKQEHDKNEAYLQNLLTDQRHAILALLPKGLDLGELLNDPTLADNTNKMEGPISSLMHKIENNMSKSD